MTFRDISLKYKYSVKQDPVGLHIPLKRGFMDIKHLTLKEMPADDRPYERFMKYGAGALSDSELLAIIVKTGCKGRTGIDVARELLTCADGSSSLLNLFRLSIQDMKDIDGVGEVKAITLKCVAEIARRLSGAQYRERVKLDEPATVAAMYMETMRHLEYEQIRIVYSDGAQRIICDEVISNGTVNKALVSVRDIFIKALEHKAVGLIMLHNHPSGDPTPSNEDISITRKLSSAGSLMDIGLIDHIIIGDGRYISLSEQGVI